MNASQKNPCQNDISTTAYEHVQKELRKFDEMFDAWSQDPHQTDLVYRKKDKSSFMSEEELNKFYKRKLKIFSLSAVQCIGGSLRAALHSYYNGTRGSGLYHSFSEKEDIKLSLERLMLYFHRDTKLHVPPELRDIIKQSHEDYEFQLVSK